MAVAVGDQRRRKEAMEHLVTELLKGDDESILISLRTAIEVSNFFHLLFGKIFINEAVDFISEVG